MLDFEQSALPDLLRTPREALDIEIKAWLKLSDPNHRATLAKGVIALANHGGGYLVIGLAQQADGRFLPADGAPTGLTDLTQDGVQDLIQKYIEPPVQCRTEHVVHPENGLKFPIVVVPGGHRVPVRAKSGSPDGKLVRDRVYIRRPGPRSEEPQTSAEWDRLFERCLRARKEELVMAIRDILAGEIPRVAGHEPTLPERLQAFALSAQRRWEELTNGLAADATPRFPLGFYEARLAIDGPFEVPSLGDFRELLTRSLRNHSGWPPFLIIDRPPYKPRIVDGSIETWMGADADGSMAVPSRCDFWRIAPEGLFYTRRGFDEDGRLKNVKPGTAFNLTTPTWRVGEIVLQAHYVAVGLGAENANLIGRFGWNGISGRQLVSIEDRHLSMLRTAYQDAYEVEVTMGVATIPTALPEIVFSILKPLYQLFDFFQLSKRMVEEELVTMMRHQYHQ